MNLVNFDRYFRVLLACCFTTRVVIVNSLPDWVVWANTILTRLQTDRSGYVYGT